MLFAAEAWPRLRQATQDLSWLLSRGYSLVSSLQLVGDRFQLEERQRRAVMRSACSDEARRLRQSRCLPVDRLHGQPLLIDGYNVLTTIEAALGGGVLLRARDGCLRDMASMHGTYRKVAETIPALRLIGGLLSAHRVGQCVWYLDSPVSNSGRLKAMMLAEASAAGWDWQVELVQSPDLILSESDGIIVTADSAILDRCRSWVNLAAAVAELVAGRRIVDLSE